MGSSHDANQAPPLQDYNLFSTDRALLDFVERAAPAFDRSEPAVLGELAGDPAMIAAGFDADRNPPELQTHDRFGERIDEVRFHPAWHVLMGVATKHGLHGAPWIERSPHAHLQRAVKFFVWSQVEAGHLCPISMTYAAVPALEHAPTLAPHWISKLAAREYDPRLLPITQKASAICGMGMTERQGGSDVRANETRAARAGTDGEYVLEGHKWFCSAPMSDAFLVLAQADRGLSCFLVPRVLPDGTRNPFALQRLKDKLGNRSNASSEVEFTGTHGWIVGEEGRGVQTIVDMVNGTRLDCVIGSAALLRAALAQAIHHATYRKTFGAALIDHGLMQNVLADLALESEAATALFVRLARAADEAPRDAQAAALKRIGTAVAKYYICKRAPAAAAEALECLGGNGYVEESIIPRLYREAPLNSIWEGCGNINALDVVRILRKQPEAVEALIAEIDPVLGDARLAGVARSLRTDLAEEDVEWRARALVERMALLWQSSLLLQQAPEYVSDAFIASRLEGGSGRTLGTLPIKTTLRAIVDRAAPREISAASPAR
ncbi:MAG TPA: acyl-CoA dehydrogenase family protein [Candidatus Baltobacteraceae bacterium]|nr:acyl-CoA dehydrogenase family protein [Candidatus Baltobacteraceae bacterium]